MDERKIENLLDKLNVPVDNLEYKYLIEAVKFFLNGNRPKITIVYKEIGKIFGKSSTSVERSIRYYVCKNQYIMKKVFNVNYNITNRRFLGLLSREIEREENIK